MNPKKSLFRTVLRTLLISLLLPLQVFAQDNDLLRKVMRKHQNGSAYVVLYFDKTTDELMKEEVFFSNGKLEWIGNYKKNVENGVWKFYHENGKIKAEETYLNGKEHGISAQYDEYGKKTSESFWKHGKMIKEIKY